MKSLAKSKIIWFAIASEYVREVQPIIYEVSEGRWESEYLFRLIGVAVQVIDCCVEILHYRDGLHSKKFSRTRF
ncbi:MAG: hypothetical protein F6K45_21550 [Kamptonema sp. SIO1D9]|nr:hypothetical protein [Kamptonema sp. SIO1D9]